MGWRPRPPPPDQASRPWQLVWSRAQWGEDTGHQETVLSVRGHVTSVTTRRQGCSLCDAAEHKTETHVTCLPKEIIVILMPYKLHIRMTRCQCAKSTTVYVDSICHEIVCTVRLSHHETNMIDSYLQFYTAHTLNPSQQVVVVKVLPPLRLVW